MERLQCTAPCQIFALFNRCTRHCEFNRVLFSKQESTPGLREQETTKGPVYLEQGPNENRSPSSSVPDKVFFTRPYQRWCASRPVSSLIMPLVKITFQFPLKSFCVVSFFHWLILLEIKYVTFSINQWARI